MLLLPALDLLSPVGAESIPDHNDVAPREIELELLKEGYAFSGTHILSRVKSEEQLRPSSGRGGC
jgi:hypothetical protein